MRRNGWRVALIEPRVADNTANTAITITITIILIKIGARSEAITMSGIGRNANNIIKDSGLLKW